jgi:hypothetical protein
VSYAVHGPDTLAINGMFVEPAVRHAAQSPGGSPHPRCGRRRRELREARGGMGRRHEGGQLRRVTGMGTGSTLRRRAAVRSIPAPFANRS